MQKNFKRCIKKYRKLNIIFKVLNYLIFTQKMKITYKNNWKKQDLIH